MTMKISFFRNLIVAFALLLSANAASAAFLFSFSDTFTSDDDYLLTSFTLNEASTVTFESTSYENGGFVPYLTLFNAAGDLLLESGSNYKNFPANLDFLFDKVLDAGEYKVLITQYDNQNNGSTLVLDAQGDPALTKSGNFTAINGCTQFCNPISGDPAPNGGVIVGGGAAVPTFVSEPETLSLMFLGLAGMLMGRRRSA
jgi:hypothetical protein